MAIAGELPRSTGADGGSAPSGAAQRADSVNTLVDLYGHHQKRIYRYCLALLRNPDDAEDATQETFTRAAPFLPNLPGDLSAYLTTVARNICCDVVRARSRRSIPIDNIPLTDRRVSPERQSIDWDVVRRMWRQLSPSERLLFAYTFAGYKYEEIASRTGMSRPSVSVGLARARRRLRDLAAATGTLALLPPLVRRLLDRAGRRLNAALNASQTFVADAIAQVGTVAISLLTGLMTISVSAGVVAAPPMAAVAAHHQAAPAAGVAGSDVVVTAGSSPARATLQADGQAPLPPPPPPARPPALVGGLASDLPGGSATLDDVGVTSMTASPSYPTDHTVYVAGVVLGDNCFVSPPALCSALFRTTDGGASWARLAPLTFTNGSVLLPPAYPVDPAFFVLTPTVGLAESPTGDGTFAWRVPGATAAAIAPWSRSGHAQLGMVIGGSVAFEEAGASSPELGPTLPAGFTATDIDFTAPGRVLVSGWVASATLAGSTGASTVCTLDGGCTAPVLFPDTSSGPTLATSPQVAADHLVLVAGATHAYVSRDGGLSFTSVLTVPSRGYLVNATVGAGPAGPRIVLSYVYSGTSQRPSVVFSDDLGAHFVDRTGDLGATAPLSGLFAYRDGSILTGLLSNTGTRDVFALRRTTDGRWTNPS